MMKHLSLMVTALLVWVAFVMPVTAQEETIVEIAAGNDDFSTLVAAVTAADLAETLSGEGPFTVFAPTNEAFTAALDELGLTLDDVVADVDLLTSILTYHVVSGEVFSGDLSDGMRVTTVNGATFVVNLSDESASLTDSAGRTVNITAVDIEASNGVIHVLDNVILPPSQNIVEIAVDNDDFSTLVAAVTAADLAETLSGEGPFTVFAPTNEAFTAALDELGLTLDDVVADVDLLANILTYHVVSGKVFSNDLSDGLEVTALNGASFTVNITDEGVTLTDGLGRVVNVVATDIEGTNGVIHVIDNVIVPPAEEAEEEETAAATGTIADIVIAGSEGGNADRDGFSYLLTAVQNANPAILDALTGEGPLTVFAPNNQGFINLAAVLGLTPAQLLSPQNQGILTDVLLYHVVAGEVRAADVVSLPNGAVVPTLLQDTQNAIIVSFNSASAPFLNNGVNLVTTDIEASNGVIHIINDVLVPQCIFDTLAGEGACGQ
ncbi:MAG: fasciclin domain-containing protein [Anaerolineae bacterium]